MVTVNHLHSSIQVTLRSDGPTISSPVREGGVVAMANYLSAEGAPRFVPALRASVRLKEAIPALTDGPTNYRSFGPKACWATATETSNESD
jgi:hypothetical protein